MIITAPPQALPHVGSAFHSSLCLSCRTSISLPRTRARNTRSLTSCMPSGNLMGRAASRWFDSLSHCSPLMLNRCNFTVIPPRLRPCFPAPPNARKRTKVRGQTGLECDAPSPVYSKRRSGILQSIQRETLDHVLMPPHTHTHRVTLRCVKAGKPARGHKNSSSYRSLG